MLTPQGNWRTGPIVGCPLCPHGEIGNLYQIPYRLLPLLDKTYGITADVNHVLTIAKLPQRLVRLSSVV